MQFTFSCSLNEFVQRAELQENVALAGSEGDGSECINVKSISHTVEPCNISDSL